MVKSVKRIALFLALTLLVSSAAAPAPFAPAVGASGAAPTASVERTVMAEGTAGTTDLPLLASYRGPNGVEIRSYSARWTAQADLKAVYDELLQNLHGPEMSKLAAVNLYPDGGGGLYYNELWSNNVNARDVADNREIDLFGADSSTLDDLARVLAHEYGHHFTNYYRYMKEGLSFTYWKEGRWADVRGIRGETQISANSEEHGWLPWEIAAEDYAQLFGSPRARKSTPFSESTRYFSNSMHNLSPQENLAIPLATEMPGYRDYWLTLSGLSVPLNAPPTRPWLRVMGEATVDGRRYLNLSWSGAADPEGGGLETTIVSYTDPLGLSFGHLTLTGRSQAQIRIPAPGSPDVFAIGGSSTAEPAPVGKRTFRLFVRDPEGLFVSSNPVEVDLSQPVVTATAAAPVGWNAGLTSAPGLPYRVRLVRPASVPWAPFRDVDPTRWYGSAVSLVSAAGLMKGDPGGSFRPDAPVTRAEFLAVLMRAYPQSGALGTPFADVPRSHWAYTLILQARGLGLVTGYQNRFDPDGWITRAEMAVLLERFLKLERVGAAPTFPDVGVEVGWAKDAIETLASYGLILGFPVDGQPVYRPQFPSYRHQVAALLSRLFQPQF